MLVSDSCVMRYRASPTAADTLLVDPSSRSVTASPAFSKSATSALMSSIPGSGSGQGGFRWPAVEQSDGAADVGHRLAAQPLGLLERLDRIVDVAVLL